MVAAIPRRTGLSRSTEDYLKVIYGLGTADEPVQTSAIAEALDVAPASVSGMLKRLAEAGLLEHVPYRGVQLTDEGRTQALRIVRRHRILESYLMTQLGYDWDSVHEEAERLEHAASDGLVERMARALGNPRYDPHGAPIPTTAGEIEEPEHVALSDIAVGQVGEFRMVSDKDPERLRFIASLGLKPGVRFRVTDRQPFNGPTTIRLAGSRAEGEPQVVGHELSQSLRCTVVIEEKAS
jgi:DtxR family transcriptional regulator, Mn-dependent transcriptional regulator